MTRVTLGAIALTLSLTLSLAACDTLSAVTQPDLDAARRARSGNAPVHLVSMGGKLDLSAYNLADETYAMTAHKDADGDVKGNFVVKLSDPVVDLRGDVTCLQVVGNLAWIGVSITNSTASTGPYASGRSFWFRVQDNGEGAEAPADRISFLNPNGGAARCNERRTGLGLAFELYGNIQVK